VYQREGEARALFRDIDTANMRASYAFFRGILGPRRLQRTTFVAIDNFVQQHVKSQQANSALSGFIGFDPPAWRPFFPTLGALAAPEDAKAAATAHRQIVKAMRAAESLQAQSAAFTKADMMIAKCEQARTVVDWQLGTLDKSWGIVPATTAGLSDAKAQALDQTAQAVSAMGERADLASKRLGIALKMLHIPAVMKAIASGPADAARAKLLLRCLGKMKTYWTDIQRVRELNNMLNAVLPRIESEEVRVKHRGKIRTIREELRPRMDAVRAELGDVPDPYSTEAADMAAELAPTTNLGSRIAGSGRYHDDPDFILEAARDMLERYTHDQRRMVGELVEIAMRVESTLERVASERKVKA
jgi:hypothetical protein